ncbi:uncharacterized protein F54H12.2 [Trichonephila clavipes]|nr:uncharacterized protein F54H12.2 [Trichonephila clavipes]
MYKVHSRIKLCGIRMLVPYTSCLKQYEDYFVDQAGNELSYYQGQSFQKGYGIEGWFKRLFPFLSRGAKSVGKEVLRTGAQIANDLLEGRNLKESAEEREKETGRILAKKAIKKADDMLGKGKAYKRKKKLPKYLIQSKDNVSSGQMPKRLVLACVDIMIHLTETTRSLPFEFNRYYMNFLGVYVDALSIPHQPLELDFEKDKYIKAYQYLFLQSEGLYLSRTEFPRGYALYLFDKTPDSCDGEHFNLIKHRTGEYFPPLQFTCRNCGGGDRGRVAIYRPFGEVSLSLHRTVTCMVLKANDRRTSCPCHDEFRGPRSDYVRQAVGSLVVRASDSRPEGLGSMPDATKHPPSTHGFTCRNCGGGDRGRVAIYRPFGEVSLSLHRTVTCMVLKANDRRTSCPCHDEFRGPRSDYVRQVASENNNKFLICTT